jgi:glutamate/tyrosine decarboxylase-like PLP-dependent enzyme
MTQRAAMLAQASTMIEAWEGRFGASDPHPASIADPEALASAWDRFEERMGDHYPFFHPRYAGQMLKPPHAVAAAGYLAAMLINPNNHALDGGPGTSALEREVVDSLAGMFGLAAPWLGHLTSSGTIANLEALWVARELHPGKAVLHSEAAHYTHGRMCQVLGVESRAVAADAHGRLDVDAVAEACARGDVGTVVVTTGTTGVGAVDAVDAVLELRERFGVRVHVDAAYGGFYALLAGDGDGDGGALGAEASAAFRAIAGCDSVVVDPHKHGLQPYGCGAVLFADPSVGVLYRHDSPYTYFTSDELHLGEISLECSRAGAAAAALWLTLQVFPLRAPSAGGGLGAMLAACRRAALGLADALRTDDALALLLEPELDIVVYHPRRDSLTEIDGASAAMLTAGMASEGADPVFLSSLRVGEALFDGAVVRDADGARVLRSVLMKPEHELRVAWLAGRLRELARSATP